MGLDVVMHLVVPAVVHVGEIRRISVALTSAFGARNFYMDVGRNEHALEMIPDRHFETEAGQSIGVRNGDTLIAVRLHEDYWGPGYERGSLERILGVAGFCREAFARHAPQRSASEITVFYGADSTRHPSVDLWAMSGQLDSTGRHATHVGLLIDHFVHHTRDYFMDQGAGDAARPHCFFCGIDVVVNSTHSGYCIGCGGRWSRADYGQPWSSSFTSPANYGSVDLTRDQLQMALLHMIAASDEATDTDFIKQRGSADGGIEWNIQLTTRGMDHAEMSQALERVWSVYLPEVLRKMLAGLPPDKLPAPSQEALDNKRRARLLAHDACTCTSMFGTRIMCPVHGKAPPPL